ncbi:Hpt domain-containing protein [Parasphingorhabdus cellanae]|uniref:Hpt domain-containing protein n=1 Tax=Parasphingorhabdus cellanae TaxID=2806553 RepID=A0ABX7T634_9SPHN|nr:Hpt domain-containing protein [Parasphingorhabdus cellanae]QTD55695.1 Hpt domain-containing protein [Parasphingorhabdus cellanae]
MAQLDSELIDWAVYSETRSSLGPDFVRILGYFREDGTQSIVKIEAAMRSKDAAQIIMPAHKLKGESMQFGAIRLAAVAELIEMTARKCVEHHEAPDEIIEQVVGLRPLFEETLPILEYESSPVVQRQSMGFGRRSSSLGNHITNS